jgi:hypothetical protein
LKGFVANVADFVVNVAGFVVNVADLSFADVVVVADVVDIVVVVLPLLVFSVAMNFVFKNASIK